MGCVDLVAARSRVEVRVPVLIPLDANSAGGQLGYYNSASIRGISDARDHFRSGGEVKVYKPDIKKAASIHYAQRRK